MTTPSKREMKQVLKETKRAIVRDETVATDTVSDDELEAFKQYMREMLRQGRRA